MPDLFEQLDQLLLPVFGGGHVLEVGIDYSHPPRRKPGADDVRDQHHPASPADLLAGEKFKAFLQEIRVGYDAILLDTPPVLPVADTVTIRDTPAKVTLVSPANGTVQVNKQLALSFSAISSSRFISSDGIAHPFVALHTFLTL
jgi:hypothetical protein